jgi:hypothetical protein
MQILEAKEELLSHSRMWKMPLCKRFLFVSFSITPFCFAFRKLRFNAANSGASTKGRMIAKELKPHRQLTLLRESSAAFDPTNAIIMYGDGLNVKARLCVS